MTDRTSTDRELHDHYASNAKATGHAGDCALVTADRNWPTIMGRPACTCGQLTAAATMADLNAALVDALDATRPAGTGCDAARSCDGCTARATR